MRTLRTVALSLCSFLPRSFDPSSGLRAAATGYSEHTPPSADKQTAPALVVAEYQLRLPSSTEETALGERRGRFRSEAVTTLFFPLFTNRAVPALATHRARDQEVLFPPTAESVGGDAHFLLFRALSFLPRAGSIAHRKPPTGRVPRRLPS